VFEAVILWVRLHREWHAETEDGATLCGIVTKARAQRVAYRPSSERCQECEASFRKLREMGEEWHGT